MRPVRRFAGCLLLCAMFLVQVSAQSAAARTEVVRRFVQSFYNWYTPVALKEGSVSPSDIALRSRKSDFTPELAHALREDSAAQAKAQDIVGLDFDPFLNSQDPDKKPYRVGKILRKGHTFQVYLYSAEGIKAEKDLRVIAEVTEKNGKCRFSDFRYTPGKDDLLSLLAKLKAERARSKAGD